MGGDGSLGAGMLASAMDHQGARPHPRWMCSAANTQPSRERRYDSVSELGGIQLSGNPCQGSGDHPQHNKRKGSGIYFHVEENKIN